jgi:PGF-CTERM protein
MVTEASGTITAGDYMVHQVSATGLDGVIEAEGGLSDALGSDAVMLSIVQTNPVQNSDPKEVNVSASTLTLVEGDGSYYIVAKTSGLVLEEDTSKEIKAGNEFKATFTVANDRLLRSDDAEDHQSVNTTFEVVAPETTLDNDPVQVQAASGQTITGASNYAPGTELTVRVRSGSDVTPGFFNTQTVMVQADGTFNASFDFSEQATGDTFAVTVRKGGTTLASADGEVVDAQTATATATTTATATATATATEAATDMPTDTAAATDEPDTDTETTSEETPGFGVAVALVALLAAALLAGRRE